MARDYLSRHAPRACCLAGSDLQVAIDAVTVAAAVDIATFMEIADFVHPGGRAGGCKRAQGGNRHKREGGLLHCSPLEMWIGFKSPAPDKTGNLYLHLEVDWFKLLIFIEFSRLIEAAAGREAVESVAIARTGLR
ncbi:hypothetical protein [Stenotrophomonas rhizophila]|uniref:hypothetical protein n=1 Tax=Stenotrophomonas rhizophila TaxID=216778 RepID=UPI001E399F76|nr:hypothetical protein [Stenotrophomonas rhizophila]MCC7632725.1 hypothetical protein [Stenotrophomonas rhizophila]MCC7662550.1 hypothetical protein [Stenotrophomonas rhizophila]